MAPPDSPEQLTLDLDFDARDLKAEEIDHQQTLRPLDLRRAVMAWLVRQGAAGLAAQTPTRVSKFKADVAAFWNQPVPSRGREGPRRILAPCRTMIVETRRYRQDCWPEISNSAELLPEYRECKQQRLGLEAEIRQTEPHLRRGDALFEEYTEWDYDESENTAYHRVRRQQHRLAQALYNGSRFESIRNAGLADYLYLAVPAKTVHPHEVADGWGLLWVANDLSVQLVAKAEEQHCEQDRRLHLVQNIASSARENVLFANGVRQLGNGCQFTPPPRRRRARRQD